jgi:RNA polymerase sigma factor (sigma-70 family)
VNEHTGDSDAAVFTALYEEHAPRVLLYAARHVDVSQAEDVVAETFTVAWRRFDVVPAGAELPWLLVVARNTIANHRRGTGKHDRVGRDAELVGRLSTVTEDVALDVAERDALIRALADLSEREREAVLIVAWDGLAGPDAAKVAGCSVNAFHVRLSRARRRLQNSLDLGSRPSPASPGRSLAQEAKP